MKKLVISKKKKVKIFKNVRKKGIHICRAASFVMMLVIMTGSMPAYAAESLKQNVTYVYHEHDGDKQAGGGCYSVPVYHTHEGSAAEGGSCYETPVYHSHVGDEVNGGPCYGTAVYHVHEGDGSVGGLCFKAVYHKHKSSCYEKILGEDDGCTILRYEDTTYDDYEGNDFKDYYMSCGDVVHGTNPSHYHSRMVCKLEGKITSYVLGCGHTEETIERYEMDCSKTAETIDFYQLSCTETEQDMDSYELGCGRDEETPIGKIILTRKLTSNKRKANLTVTYEDMSEGEVVLSENPFFWYDEQGKLLGTGEKLQVTANGKYYVIMDVQNEDVKKDSLKAETQVNNIKKEEQKTENDDSDDDSDDDTDDDTTDDSIEPTPAVTVTPTPTVVPEATPEVTSTPVVTEDFSKKVTTKSDTGIDAEETEKIADIKTPSPTPTWKVETKEVDLKEKESRNEEVLPIEAIERSEADKNTGFFSTPATKLITITASALLAIVGLLVLFYLFRWSVRVYNDDGKGNLIYLGRGMIRTEEEGYMLMITDAMVEKSVTNRYCIRSEMFHLLKNKEEELLVIRGERRQAVRIQKEMPVVI